MKKLIAVVIFSVMAVGQAQASSVSECKSKLKETREALLKLLEGGKKDDAQLGKVKSTSDQMDTCLSGLKAPAGKEAKLDELKKIWGEFNGLRKSEVYPAIEQGDFAKAKGTVVTGVQKERMTKMNGAFEQLSGDL